MTQTERIAKYLKTHKDGITSLEAINDFGITRLASVICILKKQGYKIESKLIPVINRYGEVCYVSRYKLEG
jgi:hypothetical protein